MRTIRFVGLDSLVGKMDRLERGMRGEDVAASLYAGVLVLEAEAKMQVEQVGAVDTGFLLNSIYATSKAGSTYDRRAGEAKGKADRGMEPELTVGPRQAAVVAGAEYAIYVEYGYTRGSTHVAARPFMRNAGDARQGDAVRAVERELDRRIARHGL